MKYNTIIPPSLEEGKCKKMSDDPINTLGGRMHIRWDRQVEMSTNAHHVLFSEFLRVSGLFDHLVETAPLVYTSNNAPERRNVIGTAALCILDGAKRFRHFDSLFGDTVSAELFGMTKTQSCDSVRRGLLGMNPEAALKWVWNENLHCLAPLLAQQYVLDLDPSVKTLYGHQEGAAIGYNPHKHGRPSHCFHVMSIAEVRMPVGFVILPGNETSGADSMPMLELFLGGVPEELLPYLIRGDVGFGTEKIIVICEKYKRHYLFKVRRSDGVKALWKKSLDDECGWVNAGEGWQAYECKSKLKSWTKARRTILVRRPVKDNAASTEITDMKPQAVQQEFSLVEIVGSVNPKLEDGYEWYMLVTDLEDDVSMISKTYRQRGNCENIYDEMKNQWGWGGFNSHKLACTAIAAGLTAIVANWWNVFCRLGEDGVHREAITTRPLLQRCVASIMVRSRQKIVTMYVKSKEKTYDIFSKIHTYLMGFSSATQLKPEERWMQVLNYAFRQYELKKRLFPPIVDGQYTLNL